MSERVLNFVVGIDPTYGGTQRRVDLRIMFWEVPRRPHDYKNLSKFTTVMTEF